MELQQQLMTQKLWSWKTHEWLTLAEKLQKRKMGELLLRFVQIWSKSFVAPLCKSKLRLVTF